MKKITFLTAITTSVFSINSFAQQFVNGSFEPVAGTVKCAYHSPTTFNATMGGVMATGSDTGVYVADVSCGKGAAAKGTYYVGTRFMPTKGANYFVLKLTKPMLAGFKYRFSFSYKAEDVNTALTPLIGYSNDSVSHTTYVHGIGKPTSTSWQKVNDSVTPSVNSSYIWIAGSSTGGNGEVFFDDFVMEETGGGGGGEGTAVNAIASDINIEVYPNPAADVAHINLNDAVKYPVTLAVYDVTGKLVHSEKDITRKEIVLQTAQLNTGVYMLKLTDVEGVNSIKKLMVE